MIAPSYGFDLVPVVIHAWKAWHLETMQHLGVVAVLGTGFAIDPPATLTVVSGLAFWCLFRLTIRSALAVLPLHAKATLDRWMRRTRWSSESDELRQQTRLLQLSGIGCVVLAVTPPVIAGVSQVPLDEMTRVTALVTLVIALVVGAKGVAQQLSLNHMHATASLRPPKLSIRQQEIDKQQFHRYVIYRRPSPPASEEDQEDVTFDLTDEDRSPFVGSGELVHRWLPPLTVQLLRAKNSTGATDSKRESMEELERTTPRFESQELVDHLKKAMAPMGDVNDPTRLPGFTTNDRLYIAEDDLPHRPNWLRDQPDQSSIYKIINDPYDNVHHFLEIGAILGGGELVITVFLRVTVKGRALSLDFAACALTRTPVDYHILNAFAESDAGAVVRSALRGVLDLPLEIARIWQLFEVPLLVFGAVRARKNRMLKPRRGMTIGPQLSIREEKSTPWKHAQLDKVTIHDYTKLIEQRLLKATEDFLDLHKIDTSAFQKKASNIINNGVLNMGGKTEIKQSAVGANAKVRADTREPDKSGEQSPVDEGEH